MLGAVGASPVAASADVPAAPRAISTDVSDFEFASFDAQYYLSAAEDGTSRLRVVETIVAEFPDYDQNRGIVREIPRFYQDVPIRVGVTSVTDGEGNDVYWEEDQTSEYTSLALGTDDFVYGEQTYVIEYQARDVVRSFQDSGGDEFYWDINGTESAQPFGLVSATVHIDDALTRALTGESRCYVGGYQSDRECAVEQGSATITVPGEAVGPGETLTVAVGFDGGTFVQPVLATDSWIVQIAPVGLSILMGLLLAAALVIRARHLGNAAGSGIIVAQYAVPREVDPLLAGLIAGRVKQSMPAQFLSLAVNKLVSIVDRSPESGKDDGDFDLVVMGTEGATRRELEVMKALYGDKVTAGESVSVDKLGTSVGAALHSLYARASLESVRQGLRATPAVPHKKLVAAIGGALVLAHALVFLYATVNEALSWKPLVFGILSLLLYLFALGLLTPPQRLTAKGAELKEYLLGIRLYLEVAEEERMRVLQSPEGALRIDANDRGAVLKLHERLLPFAVLWGVEKQWAKQLAFDYEAAAQSPTWTDAPVNARRLSFIVGGISAGSDRYVRPLATSSGSSWTSGSGSSFSSGSGGGGFAGGGGGGGGVGGR